MPRKKKPPVRRARNATKRIRPLRMVARKGIHPGTETPGQRRQKQTARPVISPRRRSKRAPGPQLFKRGNYLWVGGTYLGVRLRESTGEFERGPAEEYLADLLKKVREERAHGAPRIMRTLGEACDSYLAAMERSRSTVRWTLRVVEHLGPDFRCENINQTCLNDLRRALLKPGSSESNYKRQIVVVVSALVNWAAAEWGPSEGCPRPVFHRVKAGKRRTVTVLPHQAELMLKAALRRGLYLLALVLQVGLCEAPRRGELWGLRWQFIDLERQRIVLRDTKSQAGDQRDRTIVKPQPTTIGALSEWKGATDSSGGHVFLRPDGLPYSSKETFGVALNKMLKEISEEVGLPDKVTLHVLRHSAASWRYLVYPDLESLRVWADWSTISITQRYVHLLDGCDPAEVLRFWGLAQI